MGSERYIRDRIEQSVLFFLSGEGDDDGEGRFVRRTPRSERVPTVRRWDSRRHPDGGEEAAEVVLEPVNVLDLAPEV